ncbi:MAG TPA: type II secretion system F family protein [Candidatus Paceibacterota bacterium]
MLFKYSAVDDKGIKKEGEIDAPTRDVAISGLQRRGFIVVSIVESKQGGAFFSMSFFQKISPREVVILSRQIATLFGAQVSALKTFTLLASTSENLLLQRKLVQIGDDIQAGVSISGALAKHPEVFSEFYVNMVKMGEETGKLDQTFLHLADYLDRQYALTSKTRNALIYPAFVIFTFIVVLTLMFTLVIPRLATILEGSGQTIPVYTRMIIGFSDFLLSYGFVVIIFLVLGALWLWQFAKTKNGKEYIDGLKLSTPAIGNLYRKLYLSRVADNLDTMLTSGIPIIRSLDITAEVVTSPVYRNVLLDVANGVKSGMSLSSSFEKYPDQIPGIMVQMIKVGEETGSLGQILKTVALFYKREVDDAVDTLVSLIEPVMIVVLGVGVGFLLVSILVPVYNIAGGIS